MLQMRHMMLVLLTAGVPAAVQAQRISLDSIDRLQDLAAESTVIDLDRDMMQFASAFLDDGADEAAARAVLEGLDSIHVRALEFDGPDGYSEADVEAVRSQLTGEGWQRIVTIRDEDEDLGVWMHRQNEAMTGMVILAAEEDEIVVVNIVGTIRPEDLATLGGQFGIPPIEP